MKSLSCGCMNQTSDIRHPTSNVKVLRAQLHAEAYRLTRHTHMHRLLSLGSFGSFSPSRRTLNRRAISCSSATNAQAMSRSLMEPQITSSELFQWANGRAVFTQRPMGVD